MPISCQLEGRTCPHKGVEQLMDAVVPGVQLQQFPAFMEHFACCRVFSLIISLTDFLIFYPPTYLCCINAHLSSCSIASFCPFVHMMHFLWLICMEEKFEIFLSSFSAITKVETCQAQRSELSDISAAHMFVAP